MIGEFGQASSKNESIYVQDAWQPFSRLTLNLGVRVEREGVPSFTEGFEGIEFGFGQVGFDGSGEGCVDDDILIC